MSSKTPMQSQWRTNRLCIAAAGEIVKSIGSGRNRVLSRKLPAPSAPPPKSIGARRGQATRAASVVTRAVVRQQIADRLSGATSPSSLAAWARARWQKLQSGAPMESGQREKLEDVLQQLLLSRVAQTDGYLNVVLDSQLDEHRFEEARDAAFESCQAVVAAGGLLVYAVCSTDPSEGQDQWRCSCAATPTSPPCSNAARSRDLGD